MEKKQINRLPHFEAFIFDMDGVIVDSENLYTLIEQSLFRELGLDIDHQEHITYQGTSNRMMWSRIKERHGVTIPLDELEEKANEVVRAYFESVETLHPMPGAEALLALLSRRQVRLALASSSTIDIIGIILEKTGLKKYFPVVVDSRMAGAGKPDPAIFLLAAEKLGTAPERCVVVEDSTNGIAAALSASMFCVAYNGPGSEHQDQSAAHLKITDFEQLVRLLEEGEN